MAATAECHFGGGRETRNEHIGHHQMTFWWWPQATAEVFHSAVAVTATAEMTFGGGLPVPHLATADTTFAVASGNFSLF